MPQHHFRTSTLGLNMAGVLALLDAKVTKDAGSDPVHVERN
jgi:hypothetical protein